MEDWLSALIVLIIPVGLIVSLLCVLLTLLLRQRQSGELVRTISLLLILVNFILALGLVFLLLAHPYMIYALISTGVSLVAFIFIYFAKSNQQEGK